MAGCGAWTTEEENFIRQHAKEMPGRQIAEALGRPYSSVVKKRRQMGIKVARVNGRKLCQEDLEYIKQHQNKMSMATFARKFGVSVTTVYRYINEMQEHKSYHTRSPCSKTIEEVLEAGKKIGLSYGKTVLHMNTEDEK